MGTVDDYLAELDPADRAAVAHVYDIARQIAPDAEQAKGYGMPALVHHGKPLVSVMRAKAHIGIYPFSPAAIESVADELAGFDLAKGTIRFQPDHPLPDDALKRLFEFRRAQIDG